MGFYDEVPYILEKEVVNEVAERTGLPRESIYAMLHNFYDVIKESIECGVEVRLNDFGRFTYKVMKPKYAYQPRDTFRGGYLPVRDNPGYWIPQFKPKKQWRTELREKSEFWENEERENSD